MSRENVLRSYTREIDKSRIGLVIFGVSLLDIVASVMLQSLGH